MGIAEPRGSWPRIPVVAQDALGETTTRHDAGEEQPIDWDTAKRELRNRAE